MPGIFVGFVTGDPALGPFLPRRPASARELLERGRDRTRFRGCEEHRQAIATALRDLAVRMQAPAPVVAAAERLARPGTLAIVTGQQPGLFGGPLYTLHKVATALRLAREVRALDGAPDVVTVFWLHADDHDWGEANHTFLLNHALDLQRIRLARPQTAHALSAIALGDDLARAVAEARDLLPQGERAEEMLALLLPRSGDEGLPAHVTRLLLALFGDEGLLVLDPGTLPGALRQPLHGYHAGAEKLRAAMKATSAELIDRGFDASVDPEAPFLFALLPDGRRVAVRDGEACPSDALPSPGALLRNVWQDHLLPTLAYVAGPGEVSYLALGGPIYRACGVPRPPLVPRASITHVEHRLAAHLAEWDLRLPDLEAGAQELEARIAARVGGDGEPAAAGAEERVEALAETLRKELMGLEAQVAAVDPNLRVPLARLVHRQRDELRKFADKLRSQRRNQAGRFRQHARRLVGELMPRGRLQERVLPALPFLVRHGLGFAGELVAAADPFARQHLLLEWRE
jgi:uncharacterized protein YllA (UPF0747 family)